ncbi:hypothetical protein RMATCC62417_09362 [Rhizopus microsporus]|nr:hypothetical protein RMATCC62417_09362 [Rhizopus microsporus]CEI90031.1 hypothetical protein RMCBS344292_04365 [Rhizopus microsporus]
MLAIANTNTPTVNNSTRLVSFFLKKKKSSWSLRSFSKNKKIFTHISTSASSLPISTTQDEDYTLPPSYDDKSHPWAFQFPKLMTSRVIHPREEEGREELPDYECTVEKLGSAYVKCEMTEPGVRSTNRSWRFLYLQVRGTMILGYKHNPKHERRTQPIWTHSMQGAQITVATDYMKHRHVLRLQIANGPQLLIKTQTDADKMNWIDTIESSINISTDIDYRDMPQFITLRVRHRRHHHRDRRPMEETLV